MSLDWGQPIPCGASTDTQVDACDQIAVVSLKYKGSGMAHIHACVSHAAYHREFYDVIASAPIEGFTCPYVCTIEPVAFVQDDQMPQITTDQPTTP